MIVARPCHFEAPGETRALCLPSHAVTRGATQGVRCCGSQVGAEGE